MDGFFKGWVDPSGSNFRRQSPSVLRQLQRSFTKKEARKAGIEEGSEEKWEERAAEVKHPNLRSFCER